MALSLPFKRKECVGQVQVDAVCVCVHVSVCDAGYHLYRLEIKQTNLIKKKKKREGTDVYSWLICFAIWQNKHNIVKQLSSN